MQSHQRTGALAAAALTVLLWASAFPFIHIGLRAFDPIPLAALRFSIAATLMLLWLLWSRPKLPTVKDGLRLLLCGAIGVALYNVLLNTGQKSVSAGAASFIVNTVPVMTALLATMFLGERFNAWAWLGTTLSFGGIALIASGQPGGLHFGDGAMLVMGAALCSAVYFTLQRPLVASYGAKTCAPIVITFGALCLLPWLPQGLSQAVAAPSASLLAVIFLGIFPAAIGFATWTLAQAHFGASRAANFLYLVPPVSLGLSYSISGEIPTLGTICGGMTVIAGVLLVNTRGKS